jgi:BirA family biotin operon repressor/biotin-[acetyl-CoA-carboxylase] ligase
MDVIMDHIETDLDSPILVTAKKQTKGRGRRDSTWFSPEGGLYMTYALPMQMKLNLQQIRFLHYATVVGIQQALNEKKSQEILVKWPNDIYHKERKLGGVLIELISLERDILLIGVGINIIRRNSNSNELPQLDIAYLEDIDNEHLESEKIISLLSNFIFRYVNLVLAEEYENLIFIFNENLINIDKIHKFKSKLYKCKGITEKGKLRLEIEGNSHIEIPIDHSDELEVLF